MQTYVTLDANILNRYVTQGQKGCEPVEWDKLQAFIKNKTVTLLMTEVVQLEFRKFYHAFQERLNSTSSAVQQTAVAAVKDSWNEIGDLEGILVDCIQTWKKRKIDDSKDRIQKGIAFTTTVKPPYFIPLTPEIALATRKRFLEGRFKEKPKKPKQNSAKQEEERFPDADLFIIDSLVSFFNKSMADKQLLFCTEDAGFAIEFDGKTSIHPNLRAWLPDTQLFTNLKELNTFIEQQKPVEVPTEEDLEKVIEQEKHSVGKEFAMSWSIDHDIEFNQIADSSGHADKRQHNLHYHGCGDKWH